MRRRGIFSALIMLVAIVPVVQSCGAGSFLNAQNISMMIGSGIRLFVPLILEGTLKNDPQRGYMVWSGIKQSLDEFVIPLISGKDPKITDLDAWATRSNIWEQLPVSNEDVVLIQEIVNTILSYIPTEKWSESKTRGTISGDVQLMFIAGFTAFRESLDSTLLRYGHVQAAMSGKTASKIEKPNLTIKVRIDYATGSSKAHR